MKEKTPLEKIARIISEMFNGFLTITLAPILAFAISDISIIYKLLFPLMYILVTIVPYLILLKLGKVSDYEFSKREERPPYFLAASIGYFLLFIVTTFLRNDILTHVTLNVFAATCVLTIVNMYWKMSGHMTFSTVLFFTLIYIFPDISLIPYLFIASPFIAASRVILKKHTIMQVIIGTLVSASISILILYIL